MSEFADIPKHIENKQQNRQCLPLWAPLGGLGAVLERLGAVLGRLGAVLEPSWDDLGAVLGPDRLSGGVLVPN